MASEQTIGSGRSVTMAEDTERHARKNVIKYLGEALKRYEEGENAEAAKWLAEAKDEKDLVRRTTTLMRGTWHDNVAMAVSSIAGLVAGFFGGRVFDAKIVGPVPVVSLLGLLGFGGGILMRGTLTMRNVIGLGGALFTAGAILGAK